MLLRIETIGKDIINCPKAMSKCLVGISATYLLIQTINSYIVSGFQGIPVIQHFITHSYLNTLQVQLQTQIILFLSSLEFSHPVPTEYIPPFPPASLVSAIHLVNYAL